MKRERDREEKKSTATAIISNISIHFSLSLPSRRLIIHCSSLFIWLKDRLDRRIASLSLIFLLTVVYIRSLAINEREH